jgi:CNT family concentrative nucleoside transporter
VAYLLRFALFFSLSFTFVHSATAKDSAPSLEEVEPALEAPPVPHGALNMQKTEQSVSERLSGLWGLLAVFIIAIALSSNRKAIPWRLVFIGTFIQVILAIIILKTDFGRSIFNIANNAVVKILSFSNEGARFIFGNLVNMNVPVSLPLTKPSVSAADFSGAFATTGAFFAFSVLPTIIFFSALSALLYYFGILQFVVRGIAWAMEKTLGSSGTESFSAAANIFLGQTESPLLIKPFLKTLTQSEIMAVMTGGFATVAGGVLAAFVGMLVADFPDVAGHLIAASVMSAPASLVIAKIMIPETEKSLTLSAKHITVEINDSNAFDAASRGTSEGLSLCLNVGAMLIAFVALIALVNWILASLGGIVGVLDLSLDKIFAFIFAPFAYLLGVPWADAFVVGKLLGMKTAINEFVGYLQLSELLHNGGIKHAKSVIIATYALCGFANFSSIGIQIGGLSALAPSRRHDFARIAFRAMIAGTLACFQTAAIAGILL